MNLGDIIVQGGLTQREWGRQKEEAHVRDLGFKQRNLQSRQIAADEGLLPAKAELAKGQVTSQIRNIEHQENLRPTTQATEILDARSKADTRVNERIAEKTGAELKANENAQALKTQPRKFEIDEIKARLEKSALDYKKENERLLLDTQLQADKAALQAAQDSLRNITLKQTADLYRLYKFGDTDAVLKIINENDGIFGNVQYDKIVETGTAGGEKLLELTTKDGKSVSIKVSALEQLAQQYGSTYEKVGETIVRRGPDGVTPVFAQPEWAESESGQLFNKNALERPEMGGLSQGPGVGSKQQKHLDARVAQAIDKGLLRLFGAQLDPMGNWGLPEDNKQMYANATLRAGELVRGGMDPEAAAHQAYEEVTKDSAVGSVAPNSARGNALLDKQARPWR